MNEKQKKGRMKAKKDIIRLRLGVAALILVIIYIAGVWHYSSHFLRNTYINSQKVGGMELAEAEDSFTQDYDSHAITIVEKERKEKIDPKDIHMTIGVGDRISGLLKKQNQFLWFLHIFGKNNITVALDVTYDEDALKSIVDGLECFVEKNITAPQSAYIKAGEKKYEIEKEVEGNTVNKDKLLEKIKEDFSTCVTKIDLKKEELYELPKVYSDNKKLKAALKTANQYAKSKVTYDFQYTEVVVDYAKFKDWLRVSDDFEVYFDDTDVANYVLKLGKDFNTVGVARKFTTANGNEITITEGGYGWKIYQDEEYSTLIENLKSGKEIKREPVYSYEAQCYNGPNDDIGDSYVEVSILNQMVYLFIDGNCILSSSVVTGDPTKGYDTHTGIYGLTYKQRNATLTGQGYSSPVSYWMPFNGNEGLHDASWRGSFGGSIYQGGGSHGCVNCPTSVAATLYQYVDKGFPIIVH